MTSSEYSNRHRVLLRRDYTDGLEYNSGYDANGEWLYDFYPDGYPYLSAFIANMKFYDKGIAIKLAKRVAFVVSYLNPELDYEVLMEYMDILCKERFDTMGWSIDRDMVRRIVESNQILKDPSEIKMQTGYYIFRSGLTQSERISVINNNRFMSTVTKTTAVIEGAIERIKSRGDVFITSTAIRNEVGDLSISTIKRYMSIFADEVCRYNESVFGTRSFMKHVKMDSIMKIIDAIESLVILRERLSRRNVAKHSGVHFNTVQRLWMDDSIQQKLDLLNQITRGDE